MKPKALVIANPFEGRIAYFLAGLSHYYELEVWFLGDHVFTKESQVFYRWLYAGDEKFFKFISPQDVLEKSKSYDACFFHAEPFNVFSNTFSQELVHFNERAELLEYLHKIKNKAQKLYYIEMGEIFFFSFTDPAFWGLVDGVIKHHIFTKEYAYLLRQEASNPSCFKFSSTYLGDNKGLMERNKNFEVEHYYHKLYPLPFPPSLVDGSNYNSSLVERRYDVAGNFHIVHTLRCQVAKIVPETKAVYSLDYGAEYASNGSKFDRIINTSLLEKYKLTRLLSKVTYRKYHYPKLLYVKHLKNAKLFLGLGLFFSSYRTADVWGYGGVLVSWSHKKIWYGVPMVDGENYYSLGEREELSPDNMNLLEDQKGYVKKRLEYILGDKKLQEKIVAGGKATYEEYFSHPKQLVKKIFIERVNNA